MGARERTIAVGITLPLGALLLIATPTLLAAQGEIARMLPGLVIQIALLFAVVVGAALTVGLYLRMYSTSPPFSLAG